MHRRTHMFGTYRMIGHDGRLRSIQGGALAADLRPSMPLWGWVGIGAGVLVVSGVVAYTLWGKR